MSFETALNEIRNGKKTSHWMWYIFPQIRDLGKSSISKYYAIEDIEEAKEYLQNDYLRNNTIKIVSALLSLPTNNPTEILGRPDDCKLKSSMTLFHLAEPTEVMYKEVINKFYDGNFDRRTIAILKDVDKDV